jgi:hypothetical protein
MNKKLLLAATLACVAWTLVSLLPQANADATDEIKRLAALMDWGPGTVVADIGAGDGRYTFAAARRRGCWAAPENFSPPKLTKKNLPFYDPR